MDDDSDEMANGKSLKQQGNRITEKCPDSISCNGNELPSNGIDDDSPGKENQGVRNKETVGTSTPVQNVNGGAGSPLRSSLALKLKANKPSPIILSPFQVGFQIINTYFNCSNDCIFLLFSVQCVLAYLRVLKC